MSSSRSIMMMNWIIVPVIKPMPKWSSSYVRRSTAMFSISNMKTFYSIYICIYKS